MCVSRCCLICGVIGTETAFGTTGIVLDREGSGGGVSMDVESDVVGGVEVALVPIGFSLVPNGDVT